VLAIALEEVRVLLRDPAPIALVVMPLILMAFLKPAFGPVLAQLGYPEATGAEQAVPGSAVTFAFFWAAPVGLSFFREHGWGTWQRLRASPATSFEIIVGKTATVFVIIFAELLLVLAVGAVVYDMRVDGRVVASVLIAFGVTSVIVAFAIALVAICTSFMQLQSLAMVAAMVLAGVGGALTPYAVLPDWARAVAPATPSYWAMKAFREVILDNGGVSDILGAFGVMMAFTAGLVLIVALRFRSDETKTYTG
jgi:ABC-2 type transport system permease protein